MDESSFQETYIKACQEAVTHGMGIIVIQNKDQGLEISPVGPDQYVELAHALLDMRLYRIPPSNKPE